MNIDMRTRMPDGKLTVFGGSQREGYDVLVIRNDFAGDHVQSQNRIALFNRGWVAQYSAQRPQRMDRHFTKADNKIGAGSS
jgi:hypothetical protein